MGNIFSCSLSLDNVFSRCLDCTAKHTNYAWKLEEHVKSLENDRKELKRRRDDIKESIEVEERDPHMKRLKEVAGWLSDVDAMEAGGVEELIRDGRRESVNKCLGGCCPKSCTTNYKLGKKVAKKQREVTSLKNKGIFDAVTHKSSLLSADERQLEQTLGLESTFDEIWSSLKDEQVRTIGIYGMGGVGKTTLLTQVHNELCNNSIDASLSFSVVIWIVVSQIPNLTKVQDDIGEKIGLRIDSKEWKIKSQEKKADDIFRVLKGKKFVLFLDDIWKRLDLEELGVPIPNQNNKSSVVFTTRFKEVCGDMEAHKHIQVKCLEWKEAWDLFQQKVGTEALEAHPEILDLAKDVAKECDGLPLALITIGRAMACKTTPHAWHHAIDLLQRYTSEFSGMEKVFYRLKFSYDSLPNAIVRSCFLYCSLYPEDEEISKEELIEKWICEGFLVKFEDDLGKARNEGHYYISTLVHASLLEECSPEKVKMHDVIRDMALWIACDCGATKNKFFVQAGVGLSETPNVVEWEGAERVSLMKNKIREFTGTPDCPNLLTLFLNNNNNYDDSNCKFSSGFFRSMRNLRVLDLKLCKLDGFPEEICELVSLQYLNLSNNPNLRGRSPIKLQNLINLKCLNLSFTNGGVIPEGLLSSFKKLQILKLIQYSGLVSCLPKTFVEELESLKYLNDLEIRVKGDFEFSDFSSSHKLTSITTSLHITETESMRYLDLSFLTNLKSLWIKSCSELEEMIYVGEGKTRNSEIRNDVLNCCFHSLRSFKISNCNKIKNLTWLTFAPNVEEIRIENCSEMKALVADEEEGGRPININIIPFSKLTTLYLSNLSQLESIYPSALPFPCLKYLSVINCPELKKLPLNSSSSCKSGITIEGERKWLTFAPNVEEINISYCSEMKALVSDEEEGGRPINIIPFAKLTTLTLKNVPQLESIYPSALPFPCLKKLTVIRCPKLKKLPLNSSSSCKSGITIEGERKWWNEKLEWEDETTRLAFQSSFKPFN